MKKTLLALAIAATATSVNAAEIYSSETTNVSLKGEVDVYLATKETENKDVAGSKETLDPSVNVWGKIQLDAEQKFANGLTGFASFEIESGSWYDGTDNNAKFDDVYVGVKGESWGVAAGEVGDLADSDDAITKDDITNEGNYLGAMGGHHRESSGNGVVFKTKVAEKLTLVADVNTVSDEDVDNTYGVSADFAITENFAVGASYITGEAAKDVDFNLYGAAFSAEFGGFYGAVSYVEYEGNVGYGFFDNKSGPEDTALTNDYLSGNSLGLAVAYTIEDTRLYSTYAIAKADEVTATGASFDGESTNLVVGVDHAIASNITAFVEYQINETDNDLGNNEGTSVVSGVYYAF